MNNIIEIIIAVAGAIGGWEGIRYLLNLSTNKRKAEAEADGVEFHVLKEAMDFLQVQIKDKDMRFMEQTKVMRQLNNEVLELTKRNAGLELELQKLQCHVKKCPSRQPQNGY